jgi:hypothetical protein
MYVLIFENDLDYDDYCSWVGGVFNILSDAITEGMAKKETYFMVRGNRQYSSGKRFCVQKWEGNNKIVESWHDY